MDANNHCMMLAPEKRRSVSTVGLFKTNLGFRFISVVKE